MYDSNSEDEKEAPKYYKGLGLLPVVPFETLNDYSNHGIIPFVINANKAHPELIAKTHPIHVENNVCFIVDLDELQDPEDLLCDDLGSWEQSKTAKKKYILTWRDGLVTKISKLPEHQEDGHCVYRKTFINKSDSTLCKTIVNIVLPTSQHHNLIFVRYFFQGASEHRIELKPHGNAKAACSIPYLRTYRSTVAKMKDVVSQKKAGLKRIVHNVEEDVGGFENCNSPGQLPRNKRQAKYLKAECHQHKIVKDPIFEITEKMKEQSETGKKFIRAYSLDDDSPKVILFSDEQLADIANFCCDDVDGHKSILYADVTFQLGPFFVLVTSYCNTTLFTKRATHPVCPVMLC